MKYRLMLMTLVLLLLSVVGAAGAEVGPSDADIIKPQSIGSVSL